jgi:hypothetical protein
MFDTYFKVTVASTVGVCRLTGFTNSTTIVVEVLVAFGGTGTTTAWSESAWSVYRGFPTCVTAHKGRIFWGGNADEPNKIYASRQGNLLYMMQEPLTGSADVDIDPFGKVITSTKQVELRWLLGADVLTFGSTLEEGIVRSEDGRGLSLDPLGFDDRMQTSWGSKGGSVIKVHDEVFFISKLGRLRSFKYNNNNGSNTSLDLNQLADHVGDIKKMSYDSSNSIVWIVNEAFELWGLTIDQQSGILAWFQVNISGADSTAGVWDTCTTSNGSGVDVTYIIVKRTVNSVTRYYMEELLPITIEPGALNATTGTDVYLDSAITPSRVGAMASSPAYTSITGLGDLEGEVVYVRLNGILESTTYTVASSSITLGAEQTAGTFYEVGLLNTPSVKFHDPEAGGGFGSSKADIQKIHKAVLSLYKTAHLKIGGTGGNIDLPNENFGATPALFTGLKRADIAISPGEEQVVEIQVDEPYPCIIRGVAFKGQTQD